MNKETKRNRIAKILQFISISLVIASFIMMLTALFFQVKDYHNLSKNLACISIGGGGIGIFIYAIGIHILNNRINGIREDDVN